jgi:hypothetical protein
LIGLFDMVVDLYEALSSLGLQIGAAFDNLDPVAQDLLKPECHREVTSSAVELSVVICSARPKRRHCGIEPSEH